MQAIVFLPIGIRVHPWKTARNLYSIAQQRALPCDSERDVARLSQVKREVSRVGHARYLAACSNRVPASDRVARLMK
jgi:hypothetical protein